MGKKGTKRKTKWRALPLGEEVGGSGNEEEFYDEDQSTTSSVVGQPTNNYRRPTIYYRMAEKSYRQTKRFLYDRYRNKEPLVKLESKTFDEEEYTKITTPRQDVLFKKGYFGRKRESSVEETSHLTGEVDGEEPMMDQIIITNGFVDERGHYLVNGNSYEIYDPYSNTVTVVVGPPPYTNGVTQPVLAAVSCQPVPLTPVDWYPPASDWPSQGSAWTPSYPLNPSPDSLNSPEGNSSFPLSDSRIPNLYNTPAFIPGFMYGEPPALNGISTRSNKFTSVIDLSCSDENDNENKLKKTRRKSKDFNDTHDIENLGERRKEKFNESLEMNSNITSINSSITESVSESKIGMTTIIDVKSDVVLKEAEESSVKETKQVEKQSHSTQTNSFEMNENVIAKKVVLEKESHSTQTQPEETFPSNKTDLTTKKQNESNKNLPEAQIFTSFSNTQEEFKENWKIQQKYRENLNFSPKKHQEEFTRKIYPHRTNFGRINCEKNCKSEFNSEKITYAKKTMIGLENGNEKNNKAANGTTQMTKMPNKFKNAQTLTATNQNLVGNESGKATLVKQNFIERFDDRRNMKNNYSKPRCNRISSGQKNFNEKFIQKDFKIQKFKEQRLYLQPLGSAFEKKSEEESRSQSEKSSTISDLSSPTELSSGQNTPPEKLIVKKMEQKIANEINKSFKEKLKQNLKDEQNTETSREEKEVEVPVELKNDEQLENTLLEKSKATFEEGKKNKSKSKVKKDKLKENTKTKSKKRKKNAGELKEKSESDTNSSEDSFLPNFIRQKPQDLFFSTWEGVKSQKDFISEIDSILTQDKEILKSLGINEDKICFSKLPLHSDLLMMLPTFGWNRPKLKIEDFFAPTHFHSDLYTKRNITNMKSTKPEEFFASVVDIPVAEKNEKKKETGKSGKKETGKAKKETKLMKDIQTSPQSTTKKNSSSAKIGLDVSKGNVKFEGDEKSKENMLEDESVTPDGKFGIVEAVNSWLQEQEDTGKVLSVESVSEETLACLRDSVSAEEESLEQKNGVGNPIHVSSFKAEDEGSIADFRGNGGCMRVANVINDGIKYINSEFSSKKKKKGIRIYRSSSWDAKLSDIKIRKHFKFLTDSASFCQDLISDVRNGLPTKNEYAREELCDPKQSVSKYYTLAPGSQSGRVKTFNESDSENEVFDALEYKFLTKECLAVLEPNGKTAGNASITDSGVHSDTEFSEDAANENSKGNNCKLQ